MAKIDGNPYNPLTPVPHLDDSVHPTTAAVAELDPVGGSVSFYDTQVRLLPVG